MLKEFFDAVSEMAIRAYADQSVEVAGAPKHVHFAMDKAGNLRAIDLPPHPRAHKARSLQAIVEMAARASRGVAEGPTRMPPAVWYSRTGVALLLDDGTRRDRVTLDLSFSKPMEALLAWEANPAPLKQAALVLLLRTTFARCLNPSGNLLSALRTVKFKSNAEGGSVVQHGRSSVGRTIEQELAGAGALPETFALDVPVFAQAFGFTGRVEVALEPDPASESFRLLPIPGDTEQTVALAEARVGEKLAEALAEAGAEGVPVLYGQP